MTITAEPEPWLGQDNQTILAALDTLEALATAHPRPRWPKNSYTGPHPDQVDWHQLRQLVYLRDNHRCVRCGWLWDLTLDHVIPWSAGGPDTSSNLVTLCRSCNSSRCNFAETWLPRVVPVTQACDPCRISHYPDFEPSELRIVAFCGYCTATSWVSNPNWTL